MRRMNRMKTVEYIVVHCTATKLSRKKVTVKDLNRWHRDDGCAMIGYHWYIDRDGKIFPGRPERYAGAHVKGFNDRAIGVCYEGGLDEQGRKVDTRTPEQKASLWYLLKALKADYPQARILGHRDFPRVHKDCPCFDAYKEYASIE